ncbi:hypothetical protein JMJ56_29365 [Belnapia sp. T18]|uniref:Uncharacterized protein n=1 Tax=Belnapia arida TaxID=2804533 RepID=A0ABS1UD62_9PROT|nr:hypothetical protein [Belnapia arida]MBL6082090.1 hypothetical protein [Belnapia arida]
MCSFRLHQSDDAAPQPLPSGDCLPPLTLVRIHDAAGKVYDLDRRAVAEAFAELARGPAGPEPVLRVLTDFGRLTRQQVVAAGADRSMPRPLGVVL